MAGVQAAHRSPRPALQLDAHSGTLDARDPCEAIVGRHPVVAREEEAVRERTEHEIAAGNGRGRARAQGDEIQLFERRREAAVVDGEREGRSAGGQLVEQLTRERRRALRDEEPFAAQCGVVGATSSTDLPTTANAAQPAYGGGGEAFADIFFAKLDSDGNVVYLTYIGGPGDDFGQALTLETVGLTTFAYVTGGTSSQANLSTGVVLQPTYGGGLSDAFVAKIDTTVSGAAGLVYVTYLGGTNDETGTAIALVATETVEVVGESNVPLTGQMMPEEQATFLAFEPGTRLWALEEGFNQSTDGFPIVNPIQPKSTVQGAADAFVTRLGPSGESSLSCPSPCKSGVVSSSFVGGTDVERGLSVAKDDAGSTYLAGWTNSTNFPTVAAVQSGSGGGFDSWVIKLTPPSAEPPPGSPPSCTGLSCPAMAYSTYVGGDGSDIAASVTVTPAGDAYVVGTTDSTSAPAPTVPITSGATEVFVTKLAAPTTETAPPVLDFAVSGGTSGAESTSFLGANVDSDGNVWVAGSNTDGLALKIVNAVIDVRPHSKKNKINVKSKTVRVAILSTATFDAPKEVDLQTLTFGHNGDEASLVRCEKRSRRVNRDTFKDLVCRFNIKKANFEATDTSATLKGSLLAGGKVIGADMVKIIVPCDKHHKHDKKDKHGHSFDRCHCHQHGHDFDDDDDDLE
jgi:hypothetical protein